MANTYADLFTEIRYHLLEDVVNVTNTNGLADFGGASDVFRVIHDRLAEFLRRTSYEQVEATLAEAGSGVYTLPSAFLDVHRVEVGGVKIEPSGQFEADRTSSSWETDAGEVLGYFIDLSEGLTLTLVPKRTSQTVKIVYTPAPTDQSGDVATGLAATFPLPYGVRWIIKWGVIADLLGQEGELHDPVRAASAQLKFDDGITLVRLLKGLPPEEANG